MSRITLRQLFSGLLRQSPRKARRARLWVEGLEERRNPVTASWTLGVLRVDGSGAPNINDRILVRQSAGLISVFDIRSGTPLFVPIVGSPTDPSLRTVRVSDVVGIRVDAGVGNDLVDLNSAAGGFDPI